MKKVKKLVSALMALVMVFSLLAVSASAAAPKRTVEDLAYMDTATASPAQKEAILDARRQIVFGNQSWTVNGAVSAQNEDGIWEPLPEFSDLWPDWDLAEICGREPDPFPPLLPSSTEDAGTFTVHFDENIWIPPVNDFVNAPNFYEFTANGKVVYAWAESLMKGDRCNIGFEDRNTGSCMGWRPRFIGEKLAINTTWGGRYGVRASAAARDGTRAGMIVSEDPSYITIL